jgi:hypothetical protein
VKYYQSIINKYSDEVTVNPKNYLAVGFVLNIEDFQENENIYFKITLNERDAKDDAENLDFLINFESTFDITEETTFTEFSNIERKRLAVTKSTRTSFYFETTKYNSNFLKFIIKSKDLFKSSNIGFKNTETEESEKEGKSVYITLAIVFSIFAFILILIIVLGCCLGGRKVGIGRVYPIPMQQQMYGQQMYSQPQIYGQQMYGQQMNEQQQMIDQQGINQENNMNTVVQNNQTNPTPTNQNEISPMNKVEQNNQTNEKSPKS